MVMTNDEIVRDYRGARKKRDQVRILADLNLCTTKEIAQILSQAGEPVDKRFLLPGPGSRPASAAGPAVLTRAALLNALGRVGADAPLTVNGRKVISVSVRLDYDHTGRPTQCDLELTYEPEP